VICLPSGALVYDLREERDWRSGKVSRAGSGPRKTKPKPGAMLHQTAVDFGLTPSHLRAANGDAALARARRGLDVAGHVVLFRSRPEHPPLVVMAAPFSWEVHHGNRANPETVGIEAEGRYEGVEGRPNTLWQPKGRTVTPSVLTPQDVSGWREGLRYVFGVARDEGHSLEWLVSHRQSSASRRSDPGSLLWRELALWAASNIEGLRLDTTRTWADGKPVPVEWGPGGVGRY